MSFFNNMKVGKKLGVLIFVAFLALAVVGSVGYYYLQQANKQMTIMYQERFVPNDQITGVLANIRANNSFVLELMLTTDVKKNQELKQALSDGGEQTNQALAAVEKLPLDAKTTELLAKIKESQQKYRSARIAVIELAMQNKNAEAYALYSTQLAPLSNAYMDNVEKLSNYYTELGKQMNDDSQAAAATANRITIGFILVMFVIMGLMGLFIARMITRPLQAVTADCNELAAGDFRDKPRGVLREDEIGQVADALVEMRSSVRILMKKISESSEQVAASSEELTASAEQSSQAADQIASAITEVAGGANEQLTAANETSAVVEQMSASIQQIAANANQVADQSAQAADKAKEGGKTVEKAVNQMGHLESTVNNSANVVAKLGERSKEIGQIVDTISGIAGQTNLLALNAAIEAARAGEQGRGFAVVAEEVRKLAEQSQEAAKKIAGLIGEIQEDTGKAVVAMDAGTREVKTGTDMVNSAGTAFQEIAELVNQVSGQVKEISAAIQQMASGSQLIVGSVKKIDELSKASASETQSVSAATEEQLASMEEIASSSEALAKLAQDMQTAVAKFRI